jgi:hypothetical protein
LVCPRREATQDIASRCCRRATLPQRDWRGNVCSLSAWTCSLDPPISTLGRIGSSYNGLTVLSMVPHDPAHSFIRNPWPNDAHNTSASNWRSW